MTTLFGYFAIIFAVRANFPRRVVYRATDMHTGTRTIHVAYI